MRFPPALKWLSVLAVVSALLWLAAAAYLFSQEDYAPERGSLTYYLGISSLVRGAPMVEPAQEPVYFGSVGDGNKPPQSEVSYETRATDPLQAWSATDKYRNERGFSVPAGAAAGAPADFPSDERVVKSAEFRSPSGELVEVALTQAADSKRYRLRISHFD